MFYLYQKERKKRRWENKSVETDWKKIKGKTGKNKKIGKNRKRKRDEEERHDKKSRIREVTGRERKLRKKKKIRGVSD